MNPAGESITEAIARLREQVEDACPGECNDAWREATKRAVAELDRASHAAGDARKLDPLRIEHGVAYRPGQPTWCEECAGEIRSGLGRLPGLAAACGRRRDGQLAPAPAAERRALPVAPPSPSPSWDQVELIVSWTADWADRLARDLDLDDPASYRPDGFRARTLTHHTAWLVGHSAAMLAAPFADTFGRELLELVERSELVAGIDSPVVLLDDPCFLCRRRALQRKDGKDRVTCRNCGHSWPGDLFAWMVGNAAEANT